MLNKSYLKGVDTPLIRGNNNEIKYNYQENRNNKK